MHLKTQKYILFGFAKVGYSVTSCQETFNRTFARTSSENERASSQIADNVPSLLYCNRNI